MAKTYTLETESLLKPLPPQKQTDRRAWSIPLNLVWVPYFTAMKVAGKVEMADETLGAPLRLSTEKDGTPRFNTKGLPILKVAKQLADGVNMVRANIITKLTTDTATVQRADPAAYKAQLQRSHDAGEPVLQADAARVLAYLETVKAAQDAALAATQVPVAELLPVAA